MNGLQHMDKKAEKRKLINSKSFDFIFYFTSGDQFKIL